MREVRPAGRATETLRVTSVGSGRGSLEDLYVRSVPSARTTAYLMTGDRALAEDLAHEAFLRVMGRFGDLRAPEAFEAYLRRTVVTVTLNHLRRRRARTA